MGLYLTVFDGDDELDGVEVGSYSDYDTFIQCVIENVENGKKGSVCPVLTLHHDSDGEWSSQEANDLRSELVTIQSELKLVPPVNHDVDWVAQIMDEISLKPSSAYESFIDVDGELLVDRLMSLTELSVSKSLPILFQ